MGETVPTAPERRRGRYLFGLGIVAGLFVSGVVVPFAVGDDRATLATGSVADGPGTDDVAAPSSAQAAGTAVTTPAAGDAGAAVTGAEPSSTATEQLRPGAAVPLRATGRGVSASVITLGFALLDLRTVNQIGLGGAIDAPPPEQVKRYIQFYIDEVNRSGGVLGRKLVPMFATYDPTDQSTARRACLAITEDAKAFAAFVAGGFYGDPILCFTEEHGMPTFEYTSEPDSWYERSRGLLFTAAMSGTRNLRSLVSVLAAQGALEGKTIGVVSTDSPTERLPIDEGLVPALKAEGYSIAHRSTISQNTDQQPSQIPVEISQMRRAGVDYVIWVSSALVFTQWAQTAASQGYNPPYAMTDINSGSNDFTVQTAPSSTRAIAVTAIRDGEHHTNIPEHPKDRSCAERYGKAAGTTLGRGGANYQMALLACGWVELFAAAATRAGPDLTPQGLSRAVQSLGPWEFPYFAPGAFAAGKFDLADQVRVKVLDSRCTCWMPQGDLQPGARR